jgi:hypothetical protein
MAYIHTHITIQMERCAIAISLGSGDSSRFMIHQPEGQVNLTQQDFRIPLRTGFEFRKKLGVPETSEVRRRLNEQTYRKCVGPSRGGRHANKGVPYLITNLLHGMEFLSSAGPLGPLLRRRDAPATCSADHPTHYQLVGEFNTYF